jgi:glycosidase
LNDNAPSQTNAILFSNLWKFPPAHTILEAEGAALAPRFRERTMNQSIDLKSFVSDIYDGEYADLALQGLEKLISDHRDRLSEAAGRFAGSGSSDQGGSSDGGSRLPLDQSDAFVITYGDSFLLGSPPADPSDKQKAELGIGGGIEDDGTILPLAAQDRRHLRALKAFADKYLKDVVSGIHILPFFPYSSDDGFSIVDYYEVNPAIGDWSDIADIGSSFRLMADLVLNHCSAKGPWFKAFLAGEKEFEHYFIDLPGDTDVSQVVRPRTHPLLTPFEAVDPDTKEKITRHIWTTFSADQVDLNFGHPDMLIQMIDAILFFIEQGAQVIRLDAIAYLWKELGTPCIHHEKTHRVVQLYRAILDALAPWVVLITETNVPHAENMSYFGDGKNEAHMIYQFSLPPLIFDAFLRGDARHLTDWARTIPSGAPGPVGYHSTYFNFCASHDGVGVTPAHGILSEEELAGLADAVFDRGGRINYKATPSGKIPYEMNINYFSAIADADLPQDMRVKKFLASQAILLSVTGVPGIYIHSLIGSENWAEGIGLTGANRTINRRKLFLEEVMAELDDPGSLRHQVFNGYTRMIKVRRKQQAFHPAARQVILDVDAPEIFAVMREFGGDGGSAQQVLCLINTSGKPAKAKVNRSLGSPGSGGRDAAPDFFDLLSGEMFCSTLQCFDEEGDSGAAAEQRGELRDRTAVLKLAPWEVLWLDIRQP